MIATETTTREKPILFSAPMIRALLEGRKSQTRRVVQAPKCTTLFGRRPCWGRARVDPGGTIFGPGPYLKLPYGGGDYDEPDAVETRVFCPYGYPEDGARLWVRETWCGKADPQTSQLAWNADGNTYGVHYAADGRKVLLDDGDGFTAYRKDGREASPWKSGMFMPRWASRLTLEITGVRCERLQSITEADARAEGVTVPPCTYLGRCQSNSCPRHGVLDPYQQAYRQLWDCLNARRGFGWDVNPWVWVLEFRRVTE